MLFVSLFRRDLILQTFLKRAVSAGGAPSSHLHPEEQSLGAGLELQHEDASGGALAHLLEFAVIREDDQVLKTEQAQR